MPNRQTRRAAGGRGSGLPRDDIQVRAFMLADHAAQEQSGKIYVNGGGIEWIGVADPVGRLSPLWLVIRLGFPFRLTSGGHVITIRILDQDRNTIGVDPVIAANAQIGRPPGADPNDEFGLNIVVPIVGYEVSVRPNTTIYFHLI